MKRSIQTHALAILLGAAGAHAAAQTTSAGVADPHAPVPATQARPAIDYRAEPAPAVSMPGHDHHAGMDMGGKQCTKGDGKCGCCADMKMQDGGCCCDHKEAK
ncbi:MAG: hypothetical protein ACJ8HJ_10135 [Massilia sp.]